MSTAEEVFKAAWAKRDEEWDETFEDVDGYGHFAPTEPSQRVQTGLEAVAGEIIRAAMKRYIADEMPDDFAGGVLLAIEYLNGGEL